VIASRPISSTLIEQATPVYGLCEDSRYPPTTLATSPANKVNCEPFARYFILLSTSQQLFPPQVALNLAKRYAHSEPTVAQGLPRTVFQLDVDTADPLGAIASLGQHV